MAGCVVQKAPCRAVVISENLGMLQEGIICSNSGREIKKYCRPSTSLPRGARVVYEIENSRSLTFFSSSLTSVDLPEPEGAEMM
jgi:hypothetical protein